MEAQGLRSWLSRRNSPKPLRALNPIRTECTRRVHGILEPIPC